MSSEKRCEDCAYYADYRDSGRCDNAFMAQLKFLGLLKGAKECGEYRKRDEFEDWLISIIRNYEKKEIDEFKVGDPLDVKRYQEVKEVVEMILYRYQELLCEVER